MERDRATDLAVLREVHEAAQQRDHARAATLAQAALDRGLEHPLLFNVVALRLEHEQRVVEAAALLSRAVQLAPRDAGVRNALGLCLLRMERPAEALVQFEALLALDPTLSFAYASRGAALLALGLLAAAEGSYRQALERDPKQGVAMAGLAHIAARRGQHAEARRWSQQALGILPGFPDAVMSLATAELGEGAADQAEARLQALLARPELEPVDGAHANGLLGDVLDAAGRPAEAFAAYTRCNQTLRQHYAERYAGRESALEYTLALTQQLERMDTEEWRAQSAAGGETRAVATPIFILGFPRSGTTLLEVALEGNSGTVTPGEHEFLIDAVQEFMRTPAELARLPRASEAEIARLRAAYWSRVVETGIQIGTRILVDKHPLNTLKLPLIARLFPGARIALVYRDPRDVVLSGFRRRFQMSAPMYELLTLEGAARYYDAVMRFADGCQRRLPVAIYPLRYENLATDFDAELHKVCAFLGVQWTPAMRDFAPRTQLRATATPSIAQLARGLDGSGIGAWRRYQAQLAPIQPLLRPWVQHFGYATD